MFVDASAIIAILTREPEADAFANALERAPSAITSGIALFETVLGLCRKRHASIAEAQEDVAAFLRATGIGTEPVTAREAFLALEAAARYGKGRGHPAQLNMGDCFAYAAAKNHGVPLLYKGDDFDKTDMR